MHTILSNLRMTLVMYCYFENSITDKINMAIRKYIIGDYERIHNIEVNEVHRIFLSLVVSEVRDFDVDNITKKFKFQTTPSQPKI